MAWAPKKPNNLIPYLLMVAPLSQVSCDKRACINYTDGACSLVNPEKADEECLDFEDAMDFLRLRADAIKGTLG
jgi:hypothetical protein